MAGAKRDLGQRVEPIGGAVPRLFCTGRLDAEKLRPDHLDELCAMHCEPRVMATLGGVRTEAQTRSWLDANLEHWALHGYGLWVFRDRVGRFAGRGGIRRVLLGGIDETEIAYALLPDFWRLGLATEIARTFVEIGFDRLRLIDMIAFTTPENLASQRVIEKVGLRFERAFEWQGRPALLYRIGCGAWRQHDIARRAGRAAGE